MSQINIEPIQEYQLDEAVGQVALSMNSEEAAWARNTMEFYFACKKHGMDSGRDYYVWCESGRSCDFCIVTGYSSKLEHSQNGFFILKRAFF